MTATRHALRPQPTRIEDPREPPPGLIPIGEDGGSALAIDNSTLDRHMLVVGKTAAGKSQWLKWVASGVARSGYPLVVIDPHGQLADETLGMLIGSAPDRVEDIVYCDLSDPGHPVAVNPLDVHSADQVEGIVGSVLTMLISTSVFASGGDRAIDLAREALIALCHANLVIDDPQVKCTISDLPRFFTDTGFRQIVVEFCEDELIRRKFDFDTGMFELLGDAQRLKYAEPIFRAVSGLCGVESFGVALSSPQDKLDLGGLIGDGKIVLVKLASHASGWRHEACRPIGALLLSCLLSSMGSWGRRTDPSTGLEEGRGCRVIVDDAPGLIGAGLAVPEILAESRKLDVGLVVAAQYLRQFDAATADALLAGTGSKLSFVQDPSLAGPMAKAIAGADDLHEEDLAGLSNHCFYANAALPSGQTGPFSAKALAPVEDRLGPEGLLTREHVITSSRALLAADRASAAPAPR